MTTEQSTSPETVENQNTALSNQIDGDHYKKLKIQPIEYAYANNMGFIEASVLKYITRHKFKGGEKDIDKAIHCLQMLKELEYGA